MISPARSASEGEAIHLVGIDPRIGSLANDKVYAEVFHCGVEDFFHRSGQAMDFI